MGKLTDLQQELDALSQRLRELDDQQSASLEYMMSLTGKVERHVREHQAEMAQRQSELERSMREYGEARRLLHSLEEMNIEAGRRGHFHLDHDVEPEVGLDPEAGAPVTNGGPSSEPTRSPAEEEDVRYSDVDPRRLRSGIQRLMRAKETGSSHGDEAFAQRREQQAAAGLAD